MKNKIARQLAFTGVTIAVVVGLVLSTIQIVLDYQEQLERNKTLVQSTLKVASAGALQAALVLSEDEAQKVLETFSVYDFFSSVEIRDENNTTLHLITRDYESDFFSYLANILSSSERHYTIELNYEKSNMKVGELKASINNAAIWKEFYVRAARQIIVGIFRSLVLAAILLSLFHFMLTKPLLELANSLGKIDPHNPEPIKTPARILKANNELADLSNSTNKLLNEVIDAHKENEEVSNRLHHAERLSIVGKLVGGVAHDFNNILAVIRGNFEMLQFKQELDEDSQKMVTNGYKATENGAAITSQLLSYSRRQAQRPEPITIIDFFQTVESMTKTTIGNTCNVTFVAIDSTMRCFADVRQLETAILNIVINACDAMPDGGKLTIEAKQTQLDQAYCAQHDDLQAGQYICITVTDNGTGMPPEVIEKAFEPYYTTKDVGKGSGLGLSMVYGFVKQSNGHITVSSIEGEGTTFNLYLPCFSSDSVAIEPNVNQNNNTGLQVGGVNLLVVEDDAALSVVLATQLRSLGINPILTIDAESALQKVKQTDAIDGALIDVVLPGHMNGPELAEALLIEQPDISIAFMSGFMSDAITTHSSLFELCYTLKKPFSQNELEGLLGRLFETNSNKSTRKLVTS